MTRLRNTLLILGLGTALVACNDMGSSNRNTMDDDRSFGAQPSDPNE